MSKQPDKKIQAHLTSIEERVTELSIQAVNWLNKFYYSFLEFFPMKVKDSKRPKSITDFSIGVKKVEMYGEVMDVKDPEKKKTIRRRRPINATMTYAVTPFKRIMKHMNLF